MIETIKKIVENLENTSYALFRDEDTDEEEAKEFAEETLRDALERILRYPNCVIHMSNMMELWRSVLRYEGEDYRDRVEKLDKDRRIKHDAAITSISMLNRICEKLGIDQFDVNLNDRYAVGDWIGAFCGEVFMIPDCRSLDNYIDAVNWKEQNDSEIDKAVEQLIKE